ncbi:MAG TPA: N-acetylmuramoyl-L-alanine amidase [Rhodanobacteraceae bacterium]|jgi:N-acetylmuramoyl-L-alanine amidase|nr:N-acetylmuramoyl-L-alanine amidase [Rhodanobacteraceae bacterium]
MEPALTIIEQALPYVGKLQPRERADVEMVVVHCTELPDLATAREYGERIVHPSGTGNSGHYYIDRDGAVLRYVPEDRVAHHVRGQNARTLGIELVNTGRWPDWFDSRHQAMREPYPDAQVDALLALLAHLRTILPNLRDIAGHEDLDTDTLPASDDANLTVQRKLDPGLMFPWPRVMAACGLVRRRAANADRGT